DPGLSDRNFHRSSFYLPVSASLPFLDPEKSPQTRFCDCGPGRVSSAAAGTAARRPRKVPGILYFCSMKSSGCFLKTLSHVQVSHSSGSSAYL
ncbi:mCG140704, isoform CRA_a, partial [Mus musculus]